jgi:hypothetical protein
MTTALDTKLVPKALALINKFGTNATFTVSIGGTYSPATGKVSGTSTEDKIQKVSPPSRFDKSLVDGELIKATDLLVVLAASGLTFTPEQSMKVTLDTRVYTIVDVWPVMSGDKVAIYKLQLRH